MKAEHMAEFLERLGHRVIPTPSAWWYDVRTRFHLSAPHHRLIDPSRDELSVVFRSLPLGVRYFAPPAGGGGSSYALTCDNRDYDLGALSANSRSKTRRGLARCTVERLEPSWVAAHGRAVNEDTLQRIHLQDPYPWDVYWRAAAQSPCVEVWGAFVDGALAAYLVGVLADRCCELLVARSSSPLLRFYPNNALLYTVVREMFGRTEIDQVFFGVESLENYDGIDSFKLSMGFAKSPIRQRVVLHPLVRPILQSALARRALTALADRRPQDERWRKLRGIVALAAPPAERP